MIRWLAIPLSLACSAPGECRVYGEQTGVPVPEHMGATVTVDRAFAEPEREAVFAAAQTWADATRGLASLVLLPGDSSGAWAIDGVQVTGGCPKCAGLTDLGQHRIELSAANIGSVSMLYAVALHELGHFFGLGHSADRSDLMFGCYQGNDEITAADLAAFDALYGDSVGDGS